MGLDMYLTKKYYVKNWNHMDKKDIHKITILKGGKPSVIPADKVSNIECEMMYWRKANAIHKWFVDNVQDGKDDCGEYYVTRNQLANLLNICKTVLVKSEIAKGKVYDGETWNAEGHTVNYIDGKVITNAHVAQEFLPTTSGFFFGSTDYDEWYLRDIEYTVKELTEILASPEDNGSFYYSSSW
jgi:hypothetical protein